MRQINPVAAETKPGSRLLNLSGVKMAAITSVACCLPGSKQKIKILEPCKKET